eukprot:7800663-Alexandrium_andersonii.AAC.1
MVRPIKPSGSDGNKRADCGRRALVPDRAPSMIMPSPGAAWFKAGGKRSLRTSPKASEGRRPHAHCRRRRAPRRGAP